MPKSVIVVGGGLVGVASAYVLTKRGLNVVLVEAREGVALETSFANGGMITPSMPDPWNGPGVWRHFLKSLFNPDSAMLLRLGQIPALAPWGVRFLGNSRSRPHRDATLANFFLCEYSARITRAWRDDEGLEFDSADGATLKFFRSEGDMAGPLAIARSLETYGLRFEILDSRKTVELEPALIPIEDRIAGAIAFPGDGRGDAHKFTRLLADSFAKAGGRLKLGDPVSHLISAKDKVIGVALIGGETLQADAVVVCTGNAVGRMTAPFGIKLPIRPAKGYSLTFDAEGLPNLPTHPVVDDGMHAAVVPLGSRLRVVGTAEFAGEDRRIDPSRIRNLRRLLADIFPDVAVHLDGDAGTAWTGLRPMSADGKPFIGPSTMTGLWVNAGHGHLGWTMAAGSAELLACLMLGEATGVSPDPYRATRR